MVIRALMRGMQGGQSWRSDVSKESKKKEGALKIEERGHELRTRCSPDPGEGKGAASPLELLGSKQPYQHLDFSPGRHISNFSKYKPVR